jgi:hypothetical protein
MLDFLEGKASPGKLRLFAAACCRRIWHLLRDDRSCAAVEMAERFVDGSASWDELKAVAGAAQEAIRPWGEKAAAGLIRPSLKLTEEGRDAARHLAASTAAWYTAYYSRKASWQAAADVSDNARGAAETSDRQRWDDPSSEDIPQAHLLRDLFGFLPFRKLKLDRDWLTANLVALAQTIYDDRAFDRMPILADALEDAGCTNAYILNHCRQPGDHVRGCWVVDLVLGKK